MPVEGESVSPDDTNGETSASEPTPASVEELRQELEAEKQRIAALEAENAKLLAASGNADEGDVAPSGRKSHRFWVALLLVTAMILTPFTILAIFLKGQINDTGRYVSTVEPLAENPALQAYVAADVSNQLFERVNIKEYVEDALPKRAEALAGPLTSALQGFVRQAVERILQTEQFDRLWEEANRVAHSQLVNVLSGNDDGTLSANENGEVTVNLSEVTKLVQEQLASTGIDLFSDIPIANVGGKITIFRSQDLYKARTALQVLDTLAFVLPFVIIGCFAGAVFLSRNRRLGFVGCAVAFSIGAAILALALFVGRGAYLNAATGQDLPYDAAAAVYDTLLRSLHTSVRAVLFLSAIVVIAVFFAGPSRFSVWFRIRVRQGANWLGVQSDQAGWHWLAPNAFVVKRKRGLRIVVAALAFLVLFRWDRPTPLVIFDFAVVTVLLLGIIELFGREPIPEEELALLRTRREQMRAEVAKETVVRPADAAPVTPA
jgi:hypothetical protein